MLTPELLGVWRLESTACEGRTIHTRQTHLIVQEGGVSVDGELRPFDAEIAG